jgi:uncharacterized protein
MNYVTVEKTEKYIARSVDAELLKWKADLQHKPLLVRGARQVGKSSAVRNLGKNFKYFLEINFEKNKNARLVFDGDLSPKRICNDLSAIFLTPIIPGETLLFLDEIQSCENAIQSLRFFYEDYPELHVIAAGSLLEFALKNLSSFGVGRIRSMFMFPFSFDEFLLAQGYSGLVEAKKGASPAMPLSTPLHDKLVEQIRYFYLIGGMPAAVKLWIEKQNYKECIAVHNDIVLTYFDDFAKYHTKIEPQLLRNTLTTVAVNIGSKFKYSSVGVGYDSKLVKMALEMLTMAGLIIPVTHTSSNGQPLGYESNEKIKKFIFIDTGLLLRLHQLKVEDFLLSSPVEFVNKGNLAEMFVGLEILKYSGFYSKTELFFWQREEQKAQAEVDYVIIKNGVLTPVEVKAGIRGSMQSLNIFLEKKKLTSGIRCALEPFSKYANIEVFPLYAVSNFGLL